MIHICKIQNGRHFQDGGQEIPKFHEKRTSCKMKLLEF